MNAIVHEYYAAVSSNPKKAWSLLSSRYQAVFGSYANYAADANKVASVDVLAVVAQDDNSVAVALHGKAKDGETSMGQYVITFTTENGHPVIDNAQQIGSGN